uniref:C2 domain-containing protein n=1 Tax=Panagrellus redivivus TaxID=6233 RepID=A0A7E4VN96_PANRE
MPTISVDQTAKFTLSSQLYGSTPDRKIHESSDAIWRIEWCSKSNPEPRKPPNVLIVLHVSNPDISYEVISCQLNNIEGKIDNVQLAPCKRRIFTIDGALMVNVSGLKFQCDFNILHTPVSIQFILHVTLKNTKRSRNVKKVGKAALPPKPSRKSLKAAAKAAAEAAKRPVVIEYSPIAPNINEKTPAIPRLDKRMEINGWFIPMSDKINPVSSFEDTVTLKVLKCDRKVSNVLKTPKRPIKGLVDEYWWMECAILSQLNELCFYICVTAFNIEVDVLYSSPKNEIYERLQSGTLLPRQSSRICSIISKQSGFINNVFELKCKVNFYFQKNRETVTMANGYETDRPPTVANPWILGEGAPVNSNVTPMKPAIIKHLKPKRIPTPEACIKIPINNLKSSLFGQEIKTQLRNATNIDGLEWWLSCFPLVYDNDINENVVNIFLHVTVTPLIVVMTSSIKKITSQNTFFMCSKKKPMLILQIPHQHFLQKGSRIIVIKFNPTFLEPSSSKLQAKPIISLMPPTNENHCLTEVMFDADETTTTDTLSLNLGKWDLATKRIIITKKRIIPGTENVKWWILCGIDKIQRTKNPEMTTKNLTFTVCVSASPVWVKAFYQVNITNPDGATNYFVNDFVRGKRWKLSINYADFDIDSLITIKCKAAFDTAATTDLDITSGDFSQALKLNITEDFINHVKGSADVFSMESRKQIVDPDNEDLKWWLQCYTTPSKASQIPNVIAVCVRVNQVPVDVEATFVIQGAENRLWRKCLYANIDDYLCEVMVTYEELESYFENGVCEICCFADITPKPISQTDTFADNSNLNAPQLQEKNADKMSDASFTDDDSSEDEETKGMTDEQLLNRLQRQDEETEIVRQILANGNCFFDIESET